LLADWRGDTETRNEDGTSYAAPAIAGLTAVFFSNPGLNSIWQEGRVSVAVKEFFSFTANRPRSNDPIPPEVDYTPPEANSVVVGWNGMPNGYVSAPRVKIILAISIALGCIDTSMRRFG
jgi:hypothetical protein